MNERPRDCKRNCGILLYVVFLEIKGNRSIISSIFLLAVLQASRRVWKIFAGIYFRVGDFSRRNITSCKIWRVIYFTINGVTSRGNAFCRNRLYVGLENADVKIKRYFQIRDSQPGNNCQWKKYTLFLGWVTTYDEKHKSIVEGKDLLDI